MSLFNFWRGRVDYPQLQTDHAIAPTRREPNPVRREPKLDQRFKAGDLDNITWSFEGENTPINERLRHKLRRMRNRSRELCDSNDYGKRYLHLVRSNVIGPDGIKLQAQAMRDDGTPDKGDNDSIELAWRAWGQPSNCSVDRKLSFNDIEKLAASSVARDGEVLIHMVATPGRDFGLRLRVIPAEYLDEFQNEDLPNGNRIVMGIEYTDSGEVVAFHVRKNRVRSWINIYPELDYIRLPAADVIHLHITEYAEQARGIPWTVAAVRRLHLAGQYEEAELVAAFAGAAKMGHYTEDDADGVTPTEIYNDGEGGDNDEGDGELVERFEPGLIQKLPRGTKFEWSDPTHPTGAFDMFMNAVLRGAAMGLNVAHAGLSGNLEGVNFSSIRAGVLEEREQWKMIQRWIAVHLHQRIYDRWLPLAILHSKLLLPPRKIDTKYANPKWQARGWAWVDPKKDSDANRQNLAMLTETRTEILAQQGRDFETVIERLAYEKKRAEDLGLTVEDLDAEITPTQTVEVDDDGK